MKILLHASLLFFPSAAVLAGSSDAPATNLPAPSDKSAYHLFKPVPDSLLRDLDTDRPDKTNSAQTLDAGHFQLEFDIANFTHDRHNSDRIDETDDTWLFGNLNLRMGLTNFADLQLQFPAVVRERDRNHESGQVDHLNGSGDLTVALKLNAWGNDGGDTLGGVEFYVKTPTASHGLGNNKTEGGAILLWGISLPGDIGLGLNSGVAIDLNDSGSGYHADLFETISASRTLVGPLSAYLEFYSFFDPKHSSEWVGTADTGLTCTIGKNMQIDAGVNFGITRSAPDVQTFVGFSVRY